VPDAIASVQAHGLTVNPLSLRLASLFPKNLAPDHNNPTRLAIGFPNTNRADNGVLKSDLHLNDRHQLHGIYFIGDSFQREQDQPVVQPQWESQAITRAQALGVTWTWTLNPRWINEARFGYNRLWQSFLTSDANVNPTTIGINTGVTDPVNFGMPEVV